MSKENKQKCPEIPHFGAHYPDATCIDGYLWDLDSGDENVLTSGGDIPCPFCNVEVYVDYAYEGYVDWHTYPDKPTKEQEKKITEAAKNICRKDILKLHKKHGYVAAQKEGEKE